MKTFQQFLNEIKTIKYRMANKHKVYMKGKIQNVPSGHAVPFNPGGGGDGGSE
jgi:hypothetical protein